MVTLFLKHPVYNNTMTPFYPLGLFITTLAFICLFFDTNLGDNNKYSMFLFTRIQTQSPGDFEIVQNGRLLGKKETACILKYRRRMRRLIFWAIFSIYLLFSVFLGNSFLVTWSADWRLNSLKLVETILFSVYLPITNLYMVFFFHLTLRYVRIKQGSLQCKLAQLEKLITGSMEVHKNQHRTQQEHYRLWKRLNVEIAALHDEIRGDNRTWSKYLTLYFLLYVLEIVYFIHGVIFVHSERAIDKIFFVFFAIELTVLLLSITLGCSQG